MYSSSSVSNRSQSRHCFPNENTIPDKSLSNSSIDQPKPCTNSDVSGMVSSVNISQISSSDSYVPKVFPFNKLDKDSGIQLGNVEYIKLISPAMESKATKLSNPSVDCKNEINNNPEQLTHIRSTESQVPHLLHNKVISSKLERNTKPSYTMGASTTNNWNQRNTVSLPEDKTLTLGLSHSERALKPSKESYLSNAESTAHGTLVRKIISKNKLINHHLYDTSQNLCQGSLRQSSLINKPSRHIYEAVGSTINCTELYKVHVNPGRPQIFHNEDQIVLQQLTMSLTTSSGPFIFSILSGCEIRDLLSALKMDLVAHELKLSTEIRGQGHLVNCHSKPSNNSMGLAKFDAVSTQSSNQTESLSMHSYQTLFGNIVKMRASNDYKCVLIWVRSNSRHYTDNLNRFKCHIYKDQIKLCHLIKYLKSFRVKSALVHKRGYIFKDCKTIKIEEVTSKALIDDF